MILHIILNNIYGKNYIRMLNQYRFDSFNHFLITNGIISGLEDEENVELINKGLKKYIQVMKHIVISRKVIIHGMFDPRLKFLYSIYPNKTKFYWVIWGGDLYSFMFMRHTFKDIIQKGINNFIYPRITNIVTDNYYDYLIYDSHYNPRRLSKKLFRAVYYIPLLFESRLSKEKNVTSVLIGNSATQTNNHIEILLMIKTIANEKLRIVCPLSYGDMSYRDYVISEGTRLFGQNFVPITSYLNYKDYVELLKSVDVGIFYHDRQQGFGNILQLLALGKKVFIKQSVSTYRYLQDLGIIVYDYSRFTEEIMTPMTIADSLNNIALTKNYYSIENTLSKWDEILM